MAHDTPYCAHGANSKYAFISVGYASTTFFVGVGNSTSAPGSQYLSNTSDALFWSSDAVDPQPKLTEFDIELNTSSWLLFLEHTQVWRSVTASPQDSLVLSSMTPDMALWTQGA